MYKIERDVPIGDFKTTKEMIQSFLDNDCLEKCSSCFFGQDTVWINSKTPVSICDIIQMFIIIGLRETEKEYKECTK